MTESVDHSPKEPRVKDGVLRIYPPSDGEHAEALAESARAFARGDFRSARQLARQTLEGEPTDAERDFATQILSRTDMDPLALWIALGCLALFVSLVVLSVAQ
jgi:hypothetical protein